MFVHCTGDLCEDGFYYPSPSVYFRIEPIIQSLSVNVNAEISNGLAKGIFRDIANVKFVFSRINSPGSI